MPQKQFLRIFEITSIFGSLAYPNNEVHFPHFPYLLYLAGLFCQNHLNFGILNRNSQNYARINSRIFTHFAILFHLGRYNFIMWVLLPEKPTHYKWEWLAKRAKFPKSWLHECTAIYLFIFLVFMFLFWMRARAYMCMCDRWRRVDTHTETYSNYIITIIISLLVGYIP